MSRYKIILSYDGGGYNGWQIQKGVKTIQGELERILTIINNNNGVRVQGAGRTDSGVHAIGQVAHFDFIFKKKSLINFKEAINGNLPNDIRVIDCYKVTKDFHARYSAKKRYYKYRIRTDEFILDRNYTWRTEELDISILNKIAKEFIGEHDFTSFSKIDKNNTSRRCIIYDSSWKKSGSLVDYNIVGNRFLHHMVRYLVGTMVGVSKGTLKKEDFFELLRNPREDACIYKAPSNGLVLERIDYD